MSKRLALLWIVALSVVAGCESGGGHGSGGGFGHSSSSSSSSSSSGGGHSWGGSSSSSSSSSSHGSSSSSNSRPTLASSHGSHSDGGNDGLGKVVNGVLPTVAEALILGGGDYTVDPVEDERPADPSVPAVDPCQSCPLEDPCGTCVGFGHLACRDNMGVMSRCESSSSPATR